VSIGEHVYSEKHSSLAGEDEERLSDLQKALDDANCAAIFCIRGGYGVTRIVDRLDFNKFLNAPKWIIGFSDITALHLRLNRLGCESIHGIMPLLFTKSNALSSVESLQQVLFNSPESLSASSSKFNKDGQAIGQLIGGNLSIIVDSIRTNSDPDTKGKILVIEEIEEYKYKLDRMMTHLKRAGKLKELSGMIVGHMTDILDTSNPFGEEVEEIILNSVKEYKFPVGFNFSTGHDFPNLAWRSGARVKLSVTQQGSRIEYFEDSLST
jgi:muramoyltetrapeptide carboxypeptidase